MLVKVFQAVVCVVCRAVCDSVTERVWGFVTYLLFRIVRKSVVGGKPGREETIILKRI